MGELTDVVVEGGAIGIGAWEHTLREQLGETVGELQRLAVVETWPAPARHT